MQIVIGLNMVWRAVISPEQIAGIGVVAALPKGTAHHAGKLASDDDIQDAHASNTGCTGTLSSAE